MKSTTSPEFPVRIVCAGPCLSGVGLLFEEHVVVRGETNASLEDVFDACALAEEGVDELCSLGYEGGLEQVG